MRIKSMKVITSYPGEDKDPVIEFYRFNDDCWLEHEEHPGEVTNHYYLPEGNEYEALRRDEDGNICKVCYDFDDDGGLVGEVKKDKYGSIINKVFYDWIKPGRVCSVSCIDYNPDGSLQSHVGWREYYDRDGRLVFTRGNGWFENQEYGAGNLRLTRIGFDNEGKHDPDKDMVLTYNDDGLLIGFIDGDGIVGNMKYEFDAYGNWIRMEVRHNNGPVYVIKERELEYTSGIWDCNNSVVKYFSTDCHFSDKEWTRL